MTTSTKLPESSHHHRARSRVARTAFAGSVAAAALAGSFAFASSAQALTINLGGSVGITVPILDASVTVPVLPTADAGTTTVAVADAAVTVTLPVTLPVTVPPVVTTPVVIPPILGVTDAGTITAPILDPIVDPLLGLDAGIVTLPILSTDGGSITIEVPGTDAGITIQLPGIGATDAGAGGVDGGTDVLEGVFCSGASSCATGFYCNTALSICLPTLLEGAPVPVGAPACTDGSTAACASGTCDALTHTCSDDGDASTTTSGPTAQADSGTAQGGSTGGGTSGSSGSGGTATGVSVGVGVGASTAAGGTSGSASASLDAGASADAEDPGADQNGVSCSMTPASGRSGSGALPFELVLGFVAFAFRRRCATRDVSSTTRPGT